MTAGIKHDLGKPLVLKGFLQQFPLSIKNLQGGAFCGTPSVCLYLQFAPSLQNPLLQNLQFHWSVRCSRRVSTGC